MSAIVGLYYLDGRPAERSDLERMVDKLSHRGPDGSGIWCEGPAGLGHLMLHDTPESLHEKLPSLSADKDLVITADARIDNREELISRLGIKSPHEEICDSELILKAYEKWGERCPEWFLGDFAFAIWDAKNQKLFCARDHMGIKPFYYYQSPRMFAFATEIKALLTLAEVPRKKNEARIADFLVQDFGDRTATFYTDMLRLPPGQSLSVSEGRCQKTSYWALDLSREIKLGCDGDYAAEFQDVFTSAVRCRLRGGLTTGSMLSGGLDSSSIVCVARSLLASGRNRLQTFSAVFDKVPECDEREYMNAVISGGGLYAHFVAGDSTGPMSDIDTLIMQQDEPFFVPNLFLHRELYAEAERNGVRILLDGYGGDQALSHGEGYLAELARKGRLVALIKEARGISRHWGGSTGHHLLKGAVRPFLPDPAVRALRRIRRNSRRPLPLETLVQPGLSQRLGLAERARRTEETERKSLKSARASHYQDITGGINELVLETADKASATFGLSVRYPYFDRRLVAFCFALPGDQKTRQGWTRFVMRKALEDLLPEEVAQRDNKADPSPNFLRGFQEYAGEKLEELITGGDDVISDYVNLDVLRQIRRTYASGENEEDAFILWRVAVLARWLSLERLT
jgi:asparagine synthase (glutamine-hydrolysing)